MLKTKSKRQTRISHINTKKTNLNAPRQFARRGQTTPLSADRQGGQERAQRKTVVKRKSAFNFRHFKL